MTLEEIERIINLVPQVPEWDSNDDFVSFIKHECAKLLELVRAGKDLRDCLHSHFMENKNDLPDQVMKVSDAFTLKLMAMESEEVSE